MKSCRICGRPLSDSVSIERGIGPHCLNKMELVGLSPDVTLSADFGNGYVRVNDLNLFQGNYPAYKALLSAIIKYGWMEVTEMRDNVVYLTNGKMIMLTSGFYIDFVLLSRLSRCIFDAKERAALLGSFNLSDVVRFSQGPVDNMEYFQKNK